MIVYGGVDAGLVPLGDTWAFDISTRTWSLVAPLDPVNGPGVRLNAAMAYDAHRNCIVLFGGRRANNESTELGDVWELRGSTWTKLTMPAPVARWSHTLTYDSVAKRAVLFGGTPGGKTAYSDTWGFDGSEWSRLSPDTTRPGRISHGAAFDTVRGRLVTFAGRIFFGAAQYADAQVWELASTCGSIDFDGDGDEGTDADIEAFFIRLAGGPCPTAPVECESTDFDGDGDEGTDADIEAFFRRLAGGAC